MYLSNMIRINIPDFVSYTAGSTVSGTVFVDQAVTANMLIVSIKFRGNGQIKTDNIVSATPWGARSTKDFHENVPLFYQHLGLFDGLNTLPEQSTWLFSFTFPSYCDPSPADISVLGRSTFNSDAKQTLSPSCFDMQSKSGGLFRYSIFYEIEACPQARDPE